MLDIARSRRTRWLLTTGLAAGAAALATKLALPRLWHAATGEDPPMDPTNLDTTWREALTWTVAASLVSGVAGLVARRQAAAHLGAKPRHAYG